MVYNFKGRNFFYFQTVGFFGGGTYDVKDRRLNKYSRIVDNIIDSINISIRDSADAIFQNIFGIGFSCRANFTALENIRLYDNKNGENYIVAGDLFTYRPFGEVDRLDYSPGNQLVKWREDDGRELKVYKDKTIDLLDMKVFTDIKGISEDAPNGLVQIELCKKIPLWTYRWQLTKAGVGNFQFITPYFTVNKIENKIKELPVAIGLDKRPYIIVTDAFLHKVVSAGTALNIISVEIQAIKADIQLDWMTEVAFIKVLTRIDNTTTGLVGDSSQEGRFINLITYGPRISAEFFPDSRYGLKLSYQTLSTGIPNNQFDSSDGILLSKDKKVPLDGHYREQLNSFIMEGNFFATPKTKLFARVTYNFSPFHPASNFSQFQVGIRKQFISYLNERK